MGSYQNKKAAGPATEKQNAQAVKLFAEGVKFQHIMDKTGLSMAQADRAIYSNRATTRLAELGVEKVSEAAMFWLGAPSVDREHDVVFIAIAELVRDADYSQGETKTLTDRVALSRSDEAAVGLVAAERDSIQSRIDAVKAGKWTRTAASKKSLSEQVLANVTKLSDEERAAILAALNGEVQAEEPVTA